MKPPKFVCTEVFGTDAYDGRGGEAAKPPYVNDYIRAAKYDHASWLPDVNADLPDAATSKSTKVRLVRVPVLPNHHDKLLPNAIWDTVKYGHMEAKLGLCILHCAMRSMESCLKCMLERILALYKNGSESQRTIIDRDLNDAVEKSPLKLRRLARLDKNGDLVKIDLSGEEIRRIIENHSVLLDAVCKTRSSLGLDEGNMPEWRECTGHWAAMMCAGYYGPTR